MRDGKLKTGAEVDEEALQALIDAYRDVRRRVG